MSRPIPMAYVWSMLVAWIVMDCTLGVWLFHDTLADSLAIELRRAWFLLSAQTGWWVICKFGWED